MRPSPVAAILRFRRIVVGTVILFVFVFAILADVTNMSGGGASSFVEDIAVGLLIGVCLGCVLAYVLATAYPVVDDERLPESVYGTSLLASVPAFHHSTASGTELPLLSEPFEEPAEAFRTIATTLRSLRDSEQTSVVAVAAATSGSGTTTVIANSALALADMGERVLVIDGDPIGRGLTRLLAESATEKALSVARPGFSEAVGGRPLKQTIIRAGHSENLFILTSGLDADLAVNRWSRQSIRLFFEDAASSFDLVLVDVPALDSSYGIDLARAVGSLCLVVSYFDRVQLHQQLAERLRLAGIEAKGYVFNGAPSRADFRPYYPLLAVRQPPLDDEGPSSAAATARRPDEVRRVSTSSAEMPVSDRSTAGPPPKNDPTGVIPAVVDDEPDPTGQVDPVRDDHRTQQIPKVEKGRPEEG